MRRSFLRWTLPTLLVLQLGLLYIQGAQLHRQNLLLQDMHEDLVALLDRFGDGSGDRADDERLAPALRRVQPQPTLRVALRRAPEPTHAHVPWRRWVLGSAFVVGVGLIALFRLRRRH
jgi:hypothetical protein